MGLFKSESERRLERDMEIRKGISAIKRQIRTLEKNEDDYIKKARKAKQLGSNHQLAFIKTTLKKTAAQRKLMERQLLHIETMYQLKNQAEAHGEFAKSMAAVARAISDVFESTSLKEVEQNLESALTKAESIEQQMEIMLDHSETLLGTEQTAGDELVTDEEIDALLEEEVAHEESKELDQEIDQGLDEIEKELGKS